MRVAVTLAVMTMRVNLLDGKRNPLFVHGMPMADVELVSFSGNFAIVRAPGTEKDTRGRPVVRDRVVPLADVAMIDHLESAGR